jgi:hypothetical protein
MNPTSDSALEDEGDLEVDPIGADLAVFNLDLHFTHPRALDLVEGLVGAFDALLDSILEALTRRTAG